MPINRSLQFSILLLGIALCAKAYAGEPFTCTYQLRIEEGFLGEVPWTADVQVGVGDELSYVICELNDEITFALIDEPADVVYCGIVTSGEIRVSHRSHGVREWCIRHAYTGGTAYAILNTVSAQEREAGMGELLARYDRYESLADEVDAIFPELLNFGVKDGFHEPEGDRVAFTAAELHAAVVAQLPGLEGASNEPVELPPQRYSITEYTQDSLFWEEPGVRSHDIWMDGEFTSRFAVGENQNLSFQFVSHSDGMLHRGRISNGEVRLDDRDSLARSDPLNHICPPYEGPHLTTEERQLRIINYVLFQNFAAIEMWLMAEDQGRENGRWVPVITDVTVVESAFPWEADHQLGSLSEFYDRIKVLEPPNPEDRPWWLKILTSI